MILSLSTLVPFALQSPILVRSAPCRTSEFGSLYHRRITPATDSLEHRDSFQDQKTVWCPLYLVDENTRKGLRFPGD
ncbi:unnamed protein product [Haemonchus placei]|uniref:Secreted protein n=1 Tax=Haemonchus placei TaxID=6290 RepID=A0A0N4W9Y2_HAEPC|nr:unnamed protein product [Haemonchus placei]